MGYQQHSLQPLGGTEPGFAQRGQGVPQQSQQQQPQFQQQPQQQQLPSASTQAIGQPIAEQAWTVPQQAGTVQGQTGPVPQQTSVPQTAQQSSAQQVPPSTQQLPPQAQQPSVSPAQQQFGQPRGRLEQSGAPRPLSGVPVQQPPAQVPQPFGPQATQTPQAQSGMQGSEQPVNIEQASSQPPMSGRTMQATSQSIPPQTAELQSGAVRQADEQSQPVFAGSPSIDMVDTPDEIVLFVDLPGYDEENIRIQADGQNLTISAERREEDFGEGRTFAQERPQKLQRTVRLPTRADVNEANATYENGVCKISLPKIEDEKQHEIAFQ